MTDTTAAAGGLAFWRSVVSRGRKLTMTDAVRNVVLVHGGFVDGSGWQGVYDLLSRDGFRVSIVQNPTLSLSGDAAATRLIIDALDGPVVLVGHSYGGAVITEAGTHPSVAALVYVCAFAPDQGQSVGSLIAGFPADGPQPPVLPPVNGFLFLDRSRFHESFAGDLPAGQAAFLADAQVPWSVDAPAATITDPAWRSKPSWYLATSQDRMIPPVAQHAMAGKIGATVSEVAASHAVYVSQPEVVAALIAQAAAEAG
jgi:pimeloyl-ACP methyl ester carboxylesterase